MRLAELLNREVVTESGQRLGRIHDVRGELSEGRLRVTGLVVGERGILERYGFTRGRGLPGRADVYRYPVIPWERVAHVGGKVIVVAQDDDR
jgi:sporulation protein YlmC with PRC-barrel domain